MNSNSVALQFHDIKLFDPNQSTYLTLYTSDKAYALVGKFVAKQCDQSFRISQPRNSDHEGPKTQLLAGGGLHAFVWEEHKLWMLKQSHGLPVGDGCGANIFETMTIFYPGSHGRQAVLQALIEDLLAKDEVKDDSTVNLYSFHMRHQYWRKTGSQCKRPISSVFLPTGVKRTVISDLENFLSKSSRAWYMKHGIPYKRNYMFYGPPGSGKTSFIKALAGQFNRNICFLQPCHPEMTDDAFKAALQSTPRGSVLVLEDIDSLFAKGRTKLNTECPLTFSGFLNGLDGLGSSQDGQLIMMTTNFMDRLDSAVIRAGRVDLQIQLPTATQQQIARMFLNFYPGQDAYSQLFAATVVQNKLSMSSIQNHFIRHRTSSAQTAATQVDLALLRGYQHAGPAAEEEKKRKQEEAKAEQGNKESEGKEKAQEKKADKQPVETVQKVQSPGAVDVELMNKTLATQIITMLQHIARAQARSEAHTDTDPQTGSR